MEGCLCRGHKHLGRGNGAGGGGVRGRDVEVWRWGRRGDGDVGGGLQRNCLGENENDNWCGICRKVCRGVCVVQSETKPYQPPLPTVTAGVGLC